MNHSVIAVDGPSASGKSTVARRVASALRRVYVDSGSLYRGITWHALRQGVDVRQPAALVQMLNGLEIALRLEEGAVRFTIGAKDPGLELRGQDVTEAVSPVSAVPEIRARVGQLLHRATQFGPLVIEGRDIGTVVFPDAPHKFYLDASPEERARRRHQEVSAAAPASNVDTVAQSLQRRDRMDSSRAAAPLRVAPGAVVIDSTALGIDQVVALILERVRAS
jgi:cytidylate kinase